MLLAYNVLIYELFYNFAIVKIKTNQISIQQNCYTNEGELTENGFVEDCEPQKPVDNQLLKGTPWVRLYSVCGAQRVCRPA